MFSCYIFFLTVANFSINEENSTLDVDEIDGVAIICLELVSDVQLDYNINIELTLAEDMASNLTDFDANFLFISGSENGTIVCDQLVISDNIIENREEFVLKSTSISPSNSDITFTTLQSTILAINDSSVDDQFNLQSQGVH